MRIPLPPLLLSLVVAAASEVHASAARPADELCAPRAPDRTVRWFKGSYQELLDHAAKEERPIFLLFYDTDCPPCMRLMRGTLPNPAVARALRDFVAYPLEVKSRVAAPHVERWKVKNAPALVFLDADGALRDRLEGYMDPDGLAAEVRRIAQDEGTVGALRRAVEAAPEDLQARYDYAVKLETIGDKEACRTQLEKIRELDPEGEHVVSRRIRLGELQKAIERTLELKPLYAFLEEESDDELLYHAWYVAWRYERHLASATRWNPETGHAARWMKAARELWARTPEDRRAKLGNMIAWAIYEDHERLSAADHTFAREVAERAATFAPDDPYVLDTLACCLWVVGEKEEARRLIERCIELDPENPEWKKRSRELR